MNHPEPDVKFSPDFSWAASKALGFIQSQGGRVVGLMIECGGRTAHLHLDGTVSWSDTPAKTRVSESPDGPPDRVSVWWMHDNHTFTAIPGRMADILSKARELAKRSPGGMLCPPILLRGSHEVRRLKKSVHASCTELGDTLEWEAEVLADKDAISLIESRKSEAWEAS